jgi:uncharacterized protein (TIGR02588 family)
MDKVETQNQREGRDIKNWLEWTVFGLSLILVLSILGYLGYKVYHHTEVPPEIHTQVWPSPSEQMPNRYQVVVENKGGTSAEEVRVAVSIRRGGQELEKAELDVAFVPQESKREGWVVFEHAPAQSDSVVARVVSFEKP